MDKRSIHDRLMARSTKERTARSREIGDCWVVRRSRNKAGYGLIRVDGKVWLAHRAAWTAVNGPIPAETPFVLHRCDNPPCWRPAHLFTGTQADNVADRIAKGRPGGTGPGRREYCPAGHPRTAQNLVVQADGKRLCRRCLRAKESRKYHRRKLARK